MGHISRLIKKRNTAAQVAATPIPDMTETAAFLVFENRIDSSQITGTGSGGRIIKKDVTDFLKAQEQAATTTEEEE